MLVAVTVMVELPGAAVGPAWIVNKLDPDPGARKPLDAKVAVTPAGAPLTARVTGKLYPPATLTLAVAVPEPFWKTLTALADIEKLMLAGTETVASPQYVARFVPFTVPRPVLKS